MTYAYDSAGNVTQLTDARGIAVAYSYDALNRLTLADTPGTAEDVAYAYDTGPACSFGLGRLCRVSDASGITEYGYNAYANLTLERKTELGVTYNTAYQYDAGNRITAITTPDNRQITYTRNPLGQISAIAATVNGAAQTLISARRYRADGLLSAQSFGNGLTETRLYDLQGRLTTWTLGSDTRSFSYDANGNLTQRSFPQETGAYGYDALDRLSTETLPSTANHFGYDPNGNRLTDGLNPYSYSPASNRLSRAFGKDLTLDAAGNTTLDASGRSYFYTAAGTLAQTKVGTKLKGSYTYDHRNLRTRKKIGSATTVYHYDLNGQLLLETTATGSVTRAYLHDDHTPIAQIDRVSSTDTLITLHPDALGTPRLNIWGQSKNSMFNCRGSG